MTLRSIWGASVLSTLVACSGAEVGPALEPTGVSDAERLREVFSDLGQSCPNFVMGDAAGARDEIFLEAAVVDVATELAQTTTLGTLTNLTMSPRTKLVATPHLLARFDAQASISPGSPDDPSSGVALSAFSMLPRHVDDETSLLELELRLEGATQRGTPPAPKTLRFSVTTRDNQPSLARVVLDDPGQRSVLVVFRSFRVRGEPELRAIFECKMQSRQRYLERLRARP